MVHTLAAQLFIGSIIMIISIICHAVFTASAEWALRREHLWPGPRAGTFRFLVMLVGMTLWLLLSISLNVWLWAVLLLWLDVFQELEPSVYFSLVSFTTLGFGDIILAQEWRILSGLMAANGLIILGLTTAVLIDFLSRLRRN
jgi:hypothetical protein